MKLIFIFILSYLLGSLVPGYWIGKYFYNIDLCKTGSGNIGTTNSFRVLGTKAGIVVLILDILKGTLAGCLPYLFHVDINVMIVGLFAILGHTFSFWIHFKGGKAVATSAGVLLAYNPHYFVLVSTVFVLMIFISSMVSVGSIVGFLFALAYSFTLHDLILQSLAFLLTVFVLYRHKSNFKRILNGTENMVPFGINYWLKKKKSD